jgi:predicted DNA binding protein
MPLFEFVFRASYEHPFSKITESNPSVQLYQWCNDQHDVIELVLQRPEDYDHVREEFEKSVEIVDEIDNGSNVHVITRMCACGGPGTVTSYLNDPTLLVLPPVAYDSGWEYFRVIAFRHEGITKLVTKLHKAGFKVEILRKTPFDGYMASSLTLSTDTLFSSLTNKQMDALLTAYAQGYFRFPRGTDLQTIASKEKIGRTTFLEHLKKAENKIITALIPHIQVFRKIPQERKNAMRLVANAS